MKNQLLTILKSEALGAKSAIRARNLSERLGIDERAVRELIRELIAVIDVEHLRMVHGPDLIVEGNRKDVFIGTVSEDGKTWETGWVENYDYGEMFPMDPNKEGIAVPVMFKKVSN